MIDYSIYKCYNSSDIAAEHIINCINANFRITTTNRNIGGAAACPGLS